MKSKYVYFATETVKDIFGFLVFKAVEFAAMFDDKKIVVDFRIKRIGHSKQ
jgi:hypothetical protein